MRAEVEPIAEMLTSGLAGLALWWIDRPDTPKSVVLSAATSITEPVLTTKKTDGATKDAAG